MAERNDILSLTDIKVFVDAFYAKVREDDLLSEIFNGVIKDRWPEHLEKMYRFWQTVLLKEPAYFGSPFPPHAKLPVSERHFDKWKELFIKTIDEHFEGEKAEEAKWRAHKMAEMFQMKIRHFQNSGTKPLL